MGRLLPPACGALGTQTPPINMFLCPTPTGVCPPIGLHCYPGALEETLEDFWRQVWEQQVHITVMLTVGVENGRVSTPCSSPEWLPGGTCSPAGMFPWYLRSGRVGQAGVRPVGPGAW